MNSITTFTDKDLKGVSLDPKTVSVKEPYFVIHSPSREENVTVISPGKNGLEFNKTLGFINKYPGPIIYRCLYGIGVIVIQRADEFDQAKEVRVASLRPGVEVEVPYGYSHTIANIGKGFLVMLDNATEKDKYKDYDAVSAKHGLVYYIIDKKGDVGFERNPLYSFHPQITNY